MSDCFDTSSIDDRRDEDADENEIEESEKSEMEFRPILYAAEAAAASATRRETGFQSVT